MIKDTYKYLNDPRALAEIRKHQWIESQKREIGFASAAIDWITRFGEEWKKNHVYRDNNVFIERRKYRRFQLDLPISASKGDTSLVVQAVNISFLGLLFNTAYHLVKGNELCVNLVSKKSNEQVFTCGGCVERIHQLDRDQYTVFLRFNEQCQQKLENWFYFKHLSS